MSRSTRLLFAACLAALGSFPAMAEPPPVVAPPAAAPDPSEAAHRSEAIRRYEALLASSSPALQGRKDEMQFRLGLLYLEEAQASAPSLGVYGSREYYERALPLFRQVLARKDSLFREDALYYRAVALEETGRSGEALDAFRQLVREFPSSSHASEIWFRLGNDAVQKNRLAEALDDYDEVLRRGDARYRDQSAYMVAWTAYSTRQPARARALLMDLLQRLEASAQQGVNLYGESIELLARVIRTEENPSVLSGPWVGARPAFAPVVLRRAADLFRETSAFRQAATTYEQLLREYPDLPDLDGVEKLAIDSYLKAGDAARAEEARERLLARHLRGGRLAPEELADIGPFLRDSAVYLHQQARESKGYDLFRRAIDAYQQYIDSVAPGAAQAEMIFFQAEALKESGNISQAAERYKAVAEMHDPAHGEEAAFRRIALIEDLKTSGQATTDQVLATYDDYFRLYAGGAHAGALRVRQAGYLFDEKRYAESLAAGNLAVSQAANPAERQKIELMLARAAFASNDFFQCANWATQLLADRTLAADTRAEVEEIHAAAIFKAAESLQERPADAVAQYELLVRLYPRHRTAPAALYNAASLLRDHGEKEAALATYRRLIDGYPSSDLVKDATIAATNIYKEMGDSAGAATMLAKAASDSRRPGETADLLFEAGSQAREAKSPALVVETFEKFLRASPGDDVRSAIARVSIAKAYASLGRPDRAERWARETIAHAPIGGVAGDQAQQVQLLVAEARFILGEAALRRFEAIRLNEPLAASLKRKQQALDEALRELREAASYGFADVSLASNYKMGYAQLDFANAIMQAPRPRSLNPNQRVEYETLLRQQVSPFREAAAKAFRQTLDQAKTAGVENEWTARARAALGELGENPAAPVSVIVPAAS